MTKYLLGRVLLLSILLSGSLSAGYLKQRIITVDHTKVGSTDQTNFPFVICANGGTNCQALLTSSFADSGNGGLIQHTSSLTFQGRTYTVPDDLVVSSTPCAAPTLMNWEIEAYTNTNGSLTMWIKGATISHTVDTIFYLCYDNSAVSTWQGNVTGTWSPYVYVNHGSDGSTAFLYDSSPTAATIAATSGSLTTNVFTGTAPPIAFGGGAGDIDNVSSTDKSSSVGTFTKTSNFTAEGWFYWFSGTGGALTVVLSQAYAATNFLFYIGGNDGTTNSCANCFHAAVSNASADDLVSGGTFATSTWKHLLITGDGANLKFYINGSSIGTTAYNHATTGTNNSAGIAIGSLYFNGTTVQLHAVARADEVRIMLGTAAGADYVTASYNSVNNPGTFVTIGAETGPTGGFIHHKVSAQ